MEPETPNSEVLRGIEQLQSVLNNKYLTAERIMALHNPTLNNLKSILAEIDQTYTELVGVMASANVGSETIVAVTQNQHEFETRREEWVSQNCPSSLATNNLALDLPITSRQSSIHASSLSSRHSSRSSKSSHSSSSRISLKHFEAETKWKLAQFWSLNIL